MESGRLARLGGLGGRSHAGEGAVGSQGHFEFAIGAGQLVVDLLGAEHDIVTHRGDLGASTSDGDRSSVFSAKDSDQLSQGNLGRHDGLFLSVGG